MPKPVVVTETKKRDVDGEKKDFDVKSVKIESASKATIETLNPTRAAGISRVLNWCISCSGREGKDKFNFSIKQTNDWLNRPSNILAMEGDLSIGFGHLYGANFVSDSTHENLSEELSKFVKNQTEEKENTQIPSYKK